MERNEVSNYLRNIILLLLGILFLAFPIIFLDKTTDFFGIPKQMLLGIVVVLGMVLSGATMVSDKKVIVRKTPFDLPLFLLGIFVLASAFFAVNRADAFIVGIPFVLAILVYFLIVNSAKSDSSLLFLIATLVIGACLGTLINVASYFKIYILPFSFTHVQTFTPFGSLLEQAFFLAFTIPIAFYFTWLLVVKRKEVRETGIGFTIALIVLSIGFVITLIELFTIQKPFILPLETGFQTAFAAISQDTPRIIQGFLLGSGFGTYATDFTRFKQAGFNANDALWAVTFFRSSSFALELLATTGILGFGAFLFLIFKIIKESHGLRALKHNALFGGLIIAVICSFLLPLSFISQVALFIILGLFAAAKGLHPDGARHFFDVELEFVALKKGILGATSLVADPQGVREFTQKRFGKMLPVTLFVIFLLVSGTLGFFGVRYFISDFTFQKSLVAASKNQGLETYNNQVNAIQLFPYRDGFYVVYSQTNLALANSLASQQPKNASPSAQVQQTILTLIQQSINAARSATTIAPMTSRNWQNLSGIYRSLIGFGRDAETFAILSAQRAIALDPNNPQGYLTLGGIFYQLNRWEDAQRQFQIAVNLKPDFANAYYNLGHALESKGDLQEALVQYQIARSLITQDTENTKKITAEIEALQKRIQAGTTIQPPAQIQATGEQPPLEISTPSATLPTQKEKVEIPAPPKEATQSAR